MKTAQFIEEAKSVKPGEKQPKTKRGTHPNSRKNLAIPWKPGQSGNPGGKNQHDAAKEIAQAVFSENPELIYEAMVKALSKGNGYVFQVLADRGYGKLKDKVEISGDDDLLRALDEGRKRAAKR